MPDWVPTILGIILGGGAGSVVTAIVTARSRAKRDDREGAAVLIREMGDYGVEMIKHVRELEAMLRNAVKRGDHWEYKFTLLKTRIMTRGSRETREAVQDLVLAEEEFRATHGRRASDPDRA